MLHTISTSFKDLLLFLKRPADEKAPVQTKSFKIKRLFSILLADLLVSLLCVGLLGLLIHFGVVDKEQNKMNDFIEKFPVLLIIFLGVVIIPFFEELLFRYYLRFRENNFPVYLVVFGFIGIPVLLKFNVTAGLYILFASLFALTLYAILKRKADKFLRNFWMTRFGSIFYLSALIFGAVHISNYKLSLSILLLSPVLVSPQFFGGLFFGYLRVRLGFIWGYFLHALHNFIFLAIPLIVMYSPPEHLDIKNNLFSLKIEQSRQMSSFNYPQYSCQNPDSIIFERYSVKSILSNLTHKEVKFIKFDNYKYNYQKNNINVRFIRLTNDSSIGENTVLDNFLKLYKFKIEKKMILTDVWELNIVDSIKLKLNMVVKHSDSQGISYSSHGDMLIYNVNLLDLAKGFNNNYDGEYFVVNENIKSNHNYNFKIPKVRVNELNEFLKNNCGLSLKKTKRNIEHIVVSSTEKKKDELF